MIELFKINTNIARTIGLSSKEFGAKLSNSNADTKQQINLSNSNPNITIGYQNLLHLIYRLYEITLNALLQIIYLVPLCLNYPRFSEIIIIFYFYTLAQTFHLKTFKIGITWTFQSIKLLFIAFRGHPHKTLKQFFSSLLKGKIPLRKKLFCFLNSNYDSK